MIETGGPTIQEAIIIHHLHHHRSGMVVIRQGIGSSQAKHYIDKLDRYRESYYKYHTGRQWKRVENYDLCLNSAAIGLDNCVELIKKVIELKFDVKAK